MRNILTLIFSFLICFGIEMSAQEINYSRFGIDTHKGNLPKGLQVGDKAPGFSAVDQSGKEIDLYALLETAPVVLFFYRGQWCPICKRYLKNFQDSLNILTEQRIHIIAVTPETSPNIQKTEKKTGAKFTILSDKDEKIMKAYDVLFSVTKTYQSKIRIGLHADIAENNGKDEADLPVPATYIINRKGIITARYFNPDYHDRAPVKWILDHLPFDFPGPG